MIAVTKEVILRLLRDGQAGQLSRSFSINDLKDIVAKDEKSHPSTTRPGFAPDHNPNGNMG